MEEPTWKRKGYLDDHSKTAVHRYRKGAILMWPEESSGRQKRGDRGVIKDATRSSLRRFAFWLDNSYALWAVMITLTFRVEHANPKRAFKEWQSRRAWHRTEAYNYAWFMEFQERGVVHFHYFLGQDALDAHLAGFTHHWETRERGNPPKRVDLLRGAGELSLVDSWVDCVGDTSDAFLAFQHGGIVERLYSCEGAARYASTYAGKKEQKVLPPGKAPLGRWWYISQKATPQPDEISTLADYALNRPCSRLFCNNDCLTEHELKAYESITNQSRYYIQG